MALRLVADELPGRVLSGFNAFVNNLPYSLEFFVSFNFDGDVRSVDRAESFVRDAMRDAGALERSDITHADLFRAMGGRRFNCHGVLDSSTVGIDWFQWKSKSELRQAGFDLVDFSPRARVFLSHQSASKPTVERLNALLRGIDIPTWIDVRDVEYGEPLIAAIERGVADSATVIFWITPEFLKSNWCRFELDGFLHNYASRRDLVILSVVTQDVSESEIPTRLRTFKYLKLSEADEPAQVAREFATILRRRHRVPRWPGDD